MNKYTKALAKHLDSLDEDTIHDFTGNEGVENGFEAGWEAAKEEVVKILHDYWIDLDVKLKTIEDRINKL